MDLEKALMDGAVAYAAEKGVSHVAEKIAGMDKEQRETIVLIAIGVVIANALLSD